MQANGLGSLCDAALGSQTHTLLLPFSKDPVKNMVQERQDKAGVAGMGKGPFSLRIHRKWLLCGFFLSPARRVAESNSTRKLIRPSSQTSGRHGNF